MHSSFLPSTNLIIYQSATYKQIVEQITSQDVLNAENVCPSIFSGLLGLTCLSRPHPSRMFKSRTDANRHMVSLLPPLLSTNFYFPSYKCKYSLPSVSFLLSMDLGGQTGHQESECPHEISAEEKIKQKYWYALFRALSTLTYLAEQSRMWN